MTEQMSMTPYADSMARLLAGLPDVQISRPALPDDLDGSVKIFQNDLIERASIGSVRQGDDTRCGLCTILPRQGCDLPMFYSRWEEGPREITLLVDVIPTVDALVDEPYRMKYIEPLQPLWEKFAHLPGLCPEEDDALRAVCSIVYTAARVPIEKEGMRQAALAPHTAYLKHYIGFVGIAARVSDPDKLAEITRRISSVRAVFAARSLQRLEGSAAPELLQQLRDSFF